MRWLIAASAIGSAVGLAYSGYDAFNTLKWTVLVVTAMLLAVLGLVRSATERRIVLPATPVLAFVLAVVAATATSADPLQSVVGRAGRHTGLATYLACVVLFAASARLYRARSPVPLLAALLVAAAPVVGYGLLQAAGLDPLRWRTTGAGSPVFSTLGNANFFAAWAGIVTPIALWAALSRRPGRGVRSAAATLAAAAFAAAWLSGSTQGPVVAIVGAGLVAVARGWPRVALLACGAGLAGVGLTGDVAPSLGTRLGHWQAALAMFADRPWLGVGLDGFAEWYHRYRPADVAASSGLERTIDAPHSVPLDLLTGGGVLLASAYLAVIAFVAWALLTGLRRLGGEDRLLLGGIGGAWLAYQAQSLVSLDVPPLAGLGWLLGGLIVAVGAPGRERVVALHATLRPVAATATLALALAIVPATQPLRADLEAGRAARLAAAGEHAEAVRAYRRAGAVAPWEARYPRLAAQRLAALDRWHAALAAYQGALRREPRSLSDALNIGRIAAALDRDRLSDRAYRRVLRIDPTTPEIVAEAACCVRGDGRDSLFAFTQG